MASSKPKCSTRSTSSRSTVTRAGSETPPRTTEQAIEDTTMDKLMAEITKMSTTLNSVATDVSVIKATTAELVEKVNEIQERVATAEGRISSVEDDLRQLNTASTMQEDLLEKMWNRIEQLENYSRRNTVRLIGLKEGLEAGGFKKCMQKILTEGLGIEWNGEYEIERIHRVPTIRHDPDPDKPPRVVLVRFLRSSARENVLQAAKAKRGIQSWNGCRLSIFPDMSRELADKRKKFNDARKLLREIDVRHTLAFPAILRFTWKGKNMHFTCSSTAKKFISEHCIDSFTTDSDNVNEEAHGRGDGLDV